MVVEGKKYITVVMEGNEPRPLRGVHKLQAHFLKNDIGGDFSKGQLYLDKVSPILENGANLTGYYLDMDGDVRKFEVGGCNFRATLQIGLNFFNFKTLKFETIFEENVGKEKYEELKALIAHNE